MDLFPKDQGGTYLSGDNIFDIIKKLADDKNREASFFVADLSDVVEKVRIWKQKLPEIRPFYAVKCNPEEKILRLMHLLNVGFDCASKKEMQSVLDAGADPSEVIYAHPHKSVPFLRYARSRGIDLMTFDSESELLKIKEIYPEARILLRFRLSAVKAGFPLNSKFGCSFKDCGKLLILARQLHLNVVGTCFHVGSLCQEPKAYGRALRMAHCIFQVAKQIGYNFYVLDLGGGYPGHFGSLPLFYEICDEIKNGLDLWFPERGDLQLLAEPGCFFLCSAFSLCVTIIGKRVRPLDHEGDDIATNPPDDLERDEDANDETQMMYYINDSVYISFPEGIELYDVLPLPLLEKKVLAQRQSVLTTVWGCTCCSSDCIRTKCRLPVMEAGEHLVFRNMGAYTLNFHTDFNGFPKPPIHYFNNVTISECSSKNLRNPRLDDRNADDIGE